MVGVVRLEHLEVLLLQRQAAGDSLAQADQLRHHSAGKAAGDLGFFFRDALIPSSLFIDFPHFSIITRSLPRLFFLWTSNVGSKNEVQT